MSHDFIRPEHPVVLHTGSGDEYIPVNSMLTWVRENRQPGITEPELIRDMEAIGCQWTRQTAVNPENASDSITVDMFRVPARP